MTNAVVVEAGPNGLAAAIHLARHGVDVHVLEARDTIGGGARSGELTVPGLIHDHCSAFHAWAVGSPLWREVDLQTSSAVPTTGYRFFSPRVAVNPYATGVPGVYLCSQSTPLGAGIHGLCGYHAAVSALRWLDRQRSG
jgi:phytoene dehydrogenase-like protein